VNAEKVNVEEVNAEEVNVKEESECRIPLRRRDLRSESAVPVDCVTSILGTGSGYTLSSE
jgi:hypothetical protein